MGVGGGAPQLCRTQTLPGTQRLWDRAGPGSDPCSAAAQLCHLGLHFTSLSLGSSLCETGRMPLPQRALWGPSEIVSGATL